MKKILISSPLADVLLEIKPLEEDSEGLLRGGFAGLSGVKSNPSNGGCTNTDCMNNTCSNPRCINTGCNNPGCTNNQCSNEPSTSSSSGGQPVPKVIGLMI